MNRGKLLLELIEVGDPSGVDVVKFMLKDYYLQIGCINGLREFEDDLERVYKVKDYFAVKKLTNTVNRKLKVYCMSADGSTESWSLKLNGLVEWQFGHILSMNGWVNTLMKLKTRCFMESFQT